MKKLLDYCPENKKEMVDKVIEMLQDKDKVPAEAHWANPMIIKHLKFAKIIL